MPGPLDYITGIGSLVGTGASLGYNIWATNENNRRNERLMEKQNKQNISQWRRENTYNLPINQIGRMEQAGLNPNLMYGEGAGSMLSAPSPQMESSQGKAPQIDPLTSSQVALNLAQAEKIKGENEREQEKQPKVLHNIEESTQVLTKTAENLKSEGENIRALLNGIKADSERKQTEATIVEQTMNYVVAERKFSSLMSQSTWNVFDRMLLADIGLKEAEAGLAIERAKLTKSERKNLDFMLECAKYMWKFDKYYYGKNAYNQHLLGFYTTRQARLGSVSLSLQNTILSKSVKLYGFDKGFQWFSAFSSGVRDLGVGIHQAVSAFKQGNTTNINFGSPSVSY